MPTKTSAESTLPITLPWAIVSACPVHWRPTYEMRNVVADCGQNGLYVESEYSHVRQSARDEDVALARDGHDRLSHGGGAEVARSSQRRAQV